MPTTWSSEAGLNAVLSPEANRYAVFAYQRRSGLNRTSEGVVLGTRVTDLSDYVTQISLSENFNEAGVRADITMQVPPPLDNTPNVRAQLNLGMPVIIYGAYLNKFTGLVPLPTTQELLSAVEQSQGGRYGDHEIFRGFLFVKDTTSGSSGDTITLTAYDHLTYLARNRYDAAYKKRKTGTAAQKRGWTASMIIRDLCKKAGLKIDETAFVDTQTRLTTTKSYDLTLWDTCLLALEKTRYATRGAPMYHLRAKQGKVQLFKRDRAPSGPTTFTVWEFTSDDIISEASHNISIENLTTAANFVGSRKASNRRLRGRWVNRGTEAVYGRMHDVVGVGGMSDKEFARTRKSYILEHAKPDERLEVTIPCLNQIRIGDMIRVRDDLTGKYHLLWVNEVTHDINPTTPTTRLTLVRDIKKAVYPEVGDEQLKQKSSDSWSRVMRGGKTVSLGKKTVAKTDFEGTKWRGTTLTENDGYCTVARGSDMAKYKRLSVDAGRRSKQVIIVGLHDPTNRAIRLSLDVCDDLALKTGDSVEIFPLIPSRLANKK